MIFFLRSLFAQPLLNGFMVVRIWKSYELRKVWKWALIILYAIETLCYFVVFFAGYRLPMAMYATMQTMSGIWVIMQAYLIGVVLLFDVFFYFAKRFQFLPYMKEKRIRAAKITVFIGIFCFLCFQLTRGYHHIRHPVVQYYTYTFGEDGNDVRARFRLLVASDLHLGFIINARFLEHFVDEMNAQQPDIVVINGDLVDYGLRSLIIGKMDSILCRIQAPQGKFFIPGNHEYKIEPEQCLQWISDRCGLTVLRDSVVMIDSTLYLIGRDDRKNKEKRLPIEKLLGKTDPAFPRIFFSHQPGDIPDSYRCGVPLTICGHTHGGQLFPVNWMVRWIFLNGYGWRYSGKQASYTSSGLGVSGVPLRIGSRSEMLVLEIEVY